jgi:hypothetical protein
MTTNKTITEKARNSLDKLIHSFNKDTVENSYSGTIFYQRFERGEGYEFYWYVSPCMTKTIKGKCEKCKKRKFWKGGK